MSSRFCRFLLYRLMGWRADITVEHPKKYIIALAPHTSNWDFLMGQLYSRAEGFRVQFMMKKEWFFWPLGSMFRTMGGIPVERSRRTSLTDQLAQQARESETFSLCITPEGTRKAVSEWKRGFYFIAQKADLPILLYGLDYAQKRIVCTKSIIPNGNIEEQMAEIRAYFRPFRGKHPENFIA
ncbi:MAG: 1-acyl-sn-glycerol-3-phosphate acyltransferase [Bacteroidaceae bacterium]|nr:1-acyl-sn-glycerol-3-phosphate acyltransferase [Bacteroidaceae bacterium]